MPVHVARKINLEGREAGFFFEVMATRTLDFLGDTIRRGFALVKDSYQLVWKRKPLLRLYGARVGARMSEARDEADAIEQEREVEATEGVEPASEADYGTDYVVKAELPRLKEALASKGLHINTN